MENVAGIYCKGWATVTFSILATNPVNPSSLVLQPLVWKEEISTCSGPLSFSLSVDLVTLRMFCSGFMCNLLSFG